MPIGEKLFFGRFHFYQCFQGEAQGLAFVEKQNSLIVPFLNKAKKRRQDASLFPTNFGMGDPVRKLDALSNMNWNIFKNGTPVSSF